MFRKGLQYFLSQAQDIVIISEVSTEGELVNAAVTQIPDVVLLDISLASDGMDLARVVKQHVPSVAVIIISPAPKAFSWLLKRVLRDILAAILPQKN